jgi:hypothetical protein
MYCFPREEPVHRAQNKGSFVYILGLDGMTNVYKHYLRIYAEHHPFHGGNVVTRQTKIRGQGYDGIHTTNWT